MSDAHEPPVAARVAQRIVPTLPPVGVEDVDSEGSTSDHEHARQETAPSERALSSNMPLNIQPGSLNYSVLPRPQRIEPAESYEQLYEPLEESSEVGEADNTLAAQAYPGDEYDEEDDFMSTTSGGLYRPAFRPPQSPAGNSEQAAPLSRSSSPEFPLRLPGAFGQPSGNNQPTTTNSSVGRPGQTSTSAIVIQESPTPPLRPLASPNARLAASITGRCAALGDVETSVNEAIEEKKTTLGELVCPICLGPPSPLVITECGHTL